MKSLDKAMDVLEFVLNQNGEPVTPGIIAAALDINAASCVRILETLIRRGYVRKVSRRLGYATGPALFGLAMLECPYSRLTKASEVALRELAELTSSMVNISVMLAGHRYILNYYSADSRRMPISGMVHYADHYATATGRLLLSTISADELDKIIVEIGLPGDDWPEVTTREDLERELARLQADKRICYLAPPYRVIGGLIYGEECPVAAIGFGIDQYLDAAETLEQISKTIVKIESVLKLRKEFY